MQRRTHPGRTDSIQFCNHALTACLKTNYIHTASHSKCATRYRSHTEEGAALGRLLRDGAAAVGANFAAAERVGRGGTSQRQGRLCVEQTRQLLLDGVARKVKPACLQVRPCVESMLQYSRCAAADAELLLLASFPPEALKGDPQLQDRKPRSRHLMVASCMRSIRISPWQHLLNCLPPCSGAAARMEVGKPCCIQGSCLAVQKKSLLTGECVPLAYFLLPVRAHTQAHAIPVPDAL
eukprot:772396-Pelagomonas_calceolata.AAC.5